MFLGDLTATLTATRNGMPIFVLSKCDPSNPLRLCALKVRRECKGLL
jgi:hypothetical protein